MNTNMHIVTFLITIFESAMLFFMIIYFLSRPSDKSRLRYLILLLFLIQYNVMSGLFPDENFSLPTNIQIILAYYSGISVSMYFVYYIYKTFNLEKLKYYAVQGSIWFLLLPFIGLFIVPYMIWGDVDFSRRLVVIMPIVFSVLYVYTLSRSLWKKYKENTDKIDREEIIGIYVSVLLWATLPIIVLFDGSQVVENSTTNTGFLIMSILFVRSAIIKSRKDYNLILESREEFKRNNQTLQARVKERTRQLEMANEQRINTFINLVHETKTPLTLINNYLDEVIEKYDSCEELDITKMSLNHLNRNMNNFFDMHKIDKGIHIYDHSITSDFSAILRDNLKLFKSWANQKRIEIREHVEPNIHIKADPEAINRIINNLLENAIKYTNENGLIEVELKRTTELLYFNVSDNGRGISKKHQAKIFQPYYQVNRKKSNVQGIGMGLSLVNKTVESLNGEIELKSKLGIGTGITIVLKNHQNDQNDKPVPYKVNGYPNGLHSSVKLKDEVSNPGNPNLLLVEDNIQLLNLMIKKLKEFYNVYVAVNGVEAISKLKTIPKPDLIISDIMMDDMDGYKLIEVLRNQKIYQHIPFIFLTAIMTRDDKLKGLKLGAVDFISKPLQFPELKYKIDSILSNVTNQKLAFVDQAFKNLSNGHEASLSNIKTLSFEEKCKKLNLTKREVDIVELLNRGFKYKKIADTLFIAEKTVSKHASNIFGKLGINNRFELSHLLETM